MKIPSPLRGAKCNRRAILLLCLVLAACSSITAPPTATLPPANVLIIPATSTPTNTPIPTPTRTTQEAMQPYTIAGLREHEYESGEILIRETLLESEHFTRYRIEYPSDGLTISGILQVPTTGEPPFPVIVMNHGFFSRTVYASGDGTDRAAEFLNRRGYLTVSSDYRTWGDSDTAESLFYSGLAIDVINLMNALPSIPQADVERIGMWGHSMGGGVTLKVLTILAGRVAPNGSEAHIETTVKAAVLYSSVSGDFADLIERWGPGCVGDVYAGELAFGCNSSDVIPLDLPPDLTAAYFNAAADPVMLEAVSPLYHVEGISAPVQIAYGTEDGSIYAGTPPEWSLKIHAAFLEAGLEAELFAYAGEKHSFIGDPWFIFMGRTQLFFDRHLKLRL